MSIFNTNKIAIRRIYDSLFPKRARRRYFKHIDNVSDNGISGTKAEAEIFLMKYLIEPNKIFVDIGTNSGEYVYQCLKFTEGKNIFAFEPQSEYSHHLKRIFPEINVIRAALSSHEGNASLKIPFIGNKIYKTRATLEAFKESGETDSLIENVPLRTLDQEKEKYSIGPIGCVKIDVEGHELEVLKGAQSVLSKDQPTLIVEIEQRHHTDSIRIIFEWIISKGYRCLYFDVHKMKLSMVDFNNLPVNIRNFIFIHKNKNVPDIDSLGKSNKRDINKVCYFGIFDENFSRSRVISKSLKACGVEVKYCTDRTPSLRKYINLVRKHKAMNGDYDVMIVGFPGYFTVMLARFLTKKPIIFDAFISYYDSLLDRHNYSKFHPRMVYAWLIDFSSRFFANKILTINEQYRQFFIKTILTPAKKIFVLRKGADTDVFKPDINSREYDKSKSFIVGWWGTFIPLHGVQYIVEAAELLKGEKDILIEMIGRGQLKNSTIDEIQSRKLTNIKVLDPIPFEKLPQKIVEFDVVLGIFSPAPKALRCITNKVYEAMAMGKTIITEDNMANREILTNRENVLFVKPGSAEELKNAIIEMKNNSELRRQLGNNAKKLFNDNFAFENIGRELIKILNK